MNQADITSAIYYKKPLYKQSAFAYLGLEVFDFPVSTELSDIVLPLPMHPYLKEEEFDQVCSKVAGYLNEENT